MSHQVTSTACHLTVLFSVGHQFVAAVVTSSTIPSGILHREALLVLVLRMLAPTSDSMLALLDLTQ